MKLPISLMLCAALVLAACGEGSTDTSEATTETEDTSEATTETEDTTSTSIDANEAVTAYTECMRDNGVDIGDPTTDADGNLTPGSIPGLSQPGDNPGTGQEPGSGLDEETQAALQECGGLLDGTGLGFGGPAGGGDPEALQEQFAELTSCLEDQGIEITQADPSAGEGQPGGPFGGLGNLDFNDPEVETAMEQCAEFFPDFGGQGGPGDFGGQGGDDG